jgi:hypothetical protein
VRSRRHRGAAWAGGIAIALVGCTLLEPLDGFSQPRDAIDGALESSPSEGAPADGGAPRDGGADAVPEADAGPFCARVDASFCEDFDDPVRLTRWTLSNVRGAAHGVDEAAWTSPPSSLFALTNALDAGETAESYRRIDFPDRMTSLTYAFDLRIDQRGDQGFLIAAAGLDDKANTGFTYSTSFILGAGQDTVEEASEGTPSSYDDHILGSRVPVGSWSHVSVSVQRQDTGSYALVVTLDGKVVLTEALVLWKNFTSGKPYLVIGAGYVPGPTQPWAIRMDGVTMDMR